MPAKQRGLSCRERPGVAYKTHTSRRKTQRCPSTDTQADSPSPGVLPWAGSPSSIKGRGWLVIDLLESLLRNSFLGPLLQKNWKWGESVHLHFPQNCLGNHWTELSAQRVGKEQQGLDTGGPRVLKKERDKLPPYGHLRTGPPVPFKTAQFPTEEPALREMLPRVSPPACSQGCAPKSERKPWACPALSLTGTSASKETSEQRAVSEHLSMLSGGGP